MELAPTKDIDQAYVQPSNYEEVKGDKLSSNSADDKPKSPSIAELYKSEPKDMVKNRFSALRLIENSKPDEEPFVNRNEAKKLRKKSKPSKL